VLIFLFQDADDFIQDADEGIPPLEIGVGDGDKPWSGCWREGYGKITQRITRLNLNMVIISLRLIKN